jgi:hypothetical protein
MGIVCSNDDTQNWHKTFKGNDSGPSGEDDYQNPFNEQQKEVNPYDQAPVAGLGSNNSVVYFPPPMLSNQTKSKSNSNSRNASASAHPRAY